MRGTIPKVRYPAVILAVLMIGLFGCDYDVPISAEPTRKIEPALLGEWTAIEVDPKERCKSWMKVMKNDDSSYIIAYDDGLFRVHHSDFSGVPFVSAQELDSGNGKYLYMTWRLSDDGKRLTLRIVSTDLIPNATRDTASVAKLLRENLQHPKLFEEAIEFRKDQKQ